MPFPRSVRIRAMLAAARHCCLCRRYKGLKLEVHHIQPEAKGGSDRFENAIVLCFDCHADVGSYNSDHPRGTRIGADELRRARAAWYEIVETGQVQPPAELEVVHCRYIVGKSFDVLREISNLDLRRFPISNSLLVKGASLDFLGHVIRNHPEEYRRSEVWGDGYDSRDEYLRAHPDSEIRPTSHNEGFIYYTYERELTSDEIRTRIANEDGVSRLLFDAAVPSRQIARALAYEDGCGVEFPEIYQVRPLWGVFLAITNVSNQPLRFVSVGGEASGSGVSDFRPMHSLHGEKTQSIPLPEVAVSPGWTVLVPVCTVLGPLGHFPVQEGYSETMQLAPAHWQSFSHVTAVQERTLGSFAWGPAFLPQHVKFVYDGFVQQQSIHELNVSNVYEIDRHWAMASCPHAFAIDIHGVVRYLGEVLAQGSRRSVREKIKLPPNTAAVVIAEMEEEITYLETVRCGNELLLSDRLLRKGQHIVLRPTGPEITIEGFYLPEAACGERMREPTRRNELVVNFRASLNLVC